MMLIADNMKKKIFISHATEDNDFARPLADALMAYYEVWFDQYNLVVGQSLLEEISRGLSSCDYGVVIISKAFFDKHWTQNELNGLSALEEKGKKIILPVWKGVSKAEVAAYSPMLADRYSALASDGVDAVVRAIKTAVEYFDRGKTVQGDTSGIAKLRHTLIKQAEIERSNQIVGSDRGVSVALEYAKLTLSVLRAQFDAVIQGGGIENLRVDGPKSEERAVWMNIWHGALCLHARYQNTCVNSAIDSHLDLSLANVEIDPWGAIKGRDIIERSEYSIFVDNSDKRYWKSQSGDFFSEDALSSLWLDKMAEIIGKP